MSPAEKRAVVAAGIAEGLSSHALAARLGVTRAQVAGVAHHAGLGFTGRGGRPKQARAAASAVVPAAAAADLPEWGRWQAMTRSERLAAIAEGIAEQLTASAIARRVGTTRNAVIGAAYRAGMRFGPAPEEGADRATAPDAGGAVAVSADAGAAAEARGAADAPALAPEVVAPKAAVPAGGKTLMELAFGDCRFPLWGDMRPAFGDERFCAAPVVPGKAWCPEHHARCVAGWAEVPKSILKAVKDGRRAGR